MCVPVGGTNRLGGADPGARKSADRALEWSAIAHGAQGLAYFVYHSAEGSRKGTLKFDGLRALDGSPTDRLEAMTDLAGKLVPLGPVITRWQRSRITAAGC